MTLSPLDTDTYSLSETGKAKISDFNNFGWLIRFASHRNSKLKIQTWKLLKKIQTFELLKTHTTVLETAFSASIEEKELYGVRINALNFLERACEILIENESFDAERSYISLITNLVSKSSYLSISK